MGRGTIASAPGKLMLLGEHAVVYGYPCLVTAVDWRVWVQADLIPTAILDLHAPEVGLPTYTCSLAELGPPHALPPGARYVGAAILHYQNLYDLAGGLRITTYSDQRASGLGSSSAVTVATVAALAALTGVSLRLGDIFAIAYAAVLDVQGGLASGFDVAAATYGGTLYFVTGGEVIRPLSCPPPPLVVGHSGVKAITAEIVARVRERRWQAPEDTEQLFKESAHLVEQGVRAIQEGDLTALGRAMNANHEVLRALGVSTERLDILCAVAREAGAYGAKLSGAGGGDAMIALVDDECRLRVEHALHQQGARILSVRTGAPGVRVEGP